MATNILGTPADPNEYWVIEYRRDGKAHKATVYAKTLMTALSLFNTNEDTSGFDTTIRATYSYGVNGVTYRFELDGRYGVPRRV